MEKGPKFIGREYTEKEKDEITGVMDEWSKESAAPIEGEIEKNEEEVRMIDAANKLIESELTSLGITDYVPIEATNIHFIVSEGEIPDARSGSYSGVANRVVVDKRGADTKPRLFATLVHELVHNASTQRFYSDDEGGISEARVGYRIRSQWKEPTERQALTGFNEIMVESTVMKILAQNRELLKSEFGILEGELRGPIYHYMQYVPLLEKIIKGIAETKKVSPMMIFADLERGQFDKTILPVKEIERTFGKGSLRVLSYLGVLKNPTAQQELDQMVIKYFDTEDPDEKIMLERNAEAFFGKNRLFETEAKNPQ